MTIQSKVVYPDGLLRHSTGGRTVTLTDISFKETYWGTIEGAPRPETDANLRHFFLAGLEQRWGQRATHVVEPEMVEVPYPGGLIRRMPAVTCAAWLTSDPIHGAGAASELVLVWWTESLDAPIAVLLERALAGVEWARVARDFDY